MELAACLITSSGLVGRSGGAGGGDDENAEPWGVVERRRARASGRWTAKEISWGLAPIVMGSVSLDRSGEVKQRGSWKVGLVRESGSELVLVGEKWCLMFEEVRGLRRRLLWSIFVISFVM